MKRHFYITAAAMIGLLAIAVSATVPKAAAYPKIDLSGQKAHKVLEVIDGDTINVEMRQGILQRLFRCGDVRVSAQSVSAPVTILQQDMNSVCIRSIKDFVEVADLLRQKMNDHGSHNNGVQDTLAGSRS